MVKKKKQEIEESESKSRAKYKCPENLDSLITMVNGFHPDGMPKLSEYENRVEQKHSKEEFSVLTQEEKFKLEVREIIDDLGKKAGWFVIGALQQAWSQVGRFPEDSTADKLLPPDVVLAFIGVYINFKSDVDNLTELAQELNDIRKGKQSSSHIETKRFRATLIPTISENGEVKIRTNTYFSEAVDGINADRLRICEICSRIFWAKREEKETCSPQCFSNLRVRRYRTLTDEEKAERKAQREANQRRNQTLKEKRSKKNGTL